MPKISPFIFPDSPSEGAVLRKERDESMGNEGFIDDMDAAFLDGKFVEPSEAPPRIRFRDMHNYCEQVGKKPFELTKEEMAQFQY